MKTSLPVNHNKLLKDVFFDETLGYNNKQHNTVYSKRGITRQGFRQECLSGGGGRVQKGGGSGSPPPE